MKNSIILKTSILIGLSTTSLLSVSLSLSSDEIVKMVEEIKKERKGVSLVILENTGNPFIIKVPEQKESVVDDKVTPVARAEKVYTLKAILNKAAFIDGKWYKQGDRLGNYKIGHVSSNTVVLKSSNGNKKLTLKKRKKSFIKLNRGYK